MYNCRKHTCSIIIIMLQEGLSYICGVKMGNEVNLQQKAAMAREIAYEELKNYLSINLLRYPKV